MNKPHRLYFSGYSDDVVMSATSDAAQYSEYYAEHFLLSDGSTVRFWHGDDGWQCTTTAKFYTVIDAVDEDDTGVEHTNSLIPDWLKPCGYSPVLIIGSDSPLSIMLRSDSKFSAEVLSGDPLALVTAIISEGVSNDEDSDDIAAKVLALPMLKHAAQMFDATKGGHA